MTGEWFHMVVVRQSEPSETRGRQNLLVLIPVPIRKQPQRGIATFSHGHRRLGLGPLAGSVSPILGSPWTGQGRESPEGSWLSLLIMTLVYQGGKLEWREGWTLHPRQGRA